MTSAKRLFGFNPREVKRYMSKLETDIKQALAEKELQQQSYDLKRDELLQQVDELTERVSHLGELEQELRTWIEKSH
ncbi:hypothetical protein EHS13_18870 [Paenibacillus psychroresistens]|uniref:Uncharacterized protein n=1 Tax=Paenibacillus psychroresistens TaxID=1778678 RepID=A0A6B8RMM5_9BACL|nr:hypothetical protein [Paenibacillus psychroresistens]QGQ96795.1 hypothetical protein EHS13_18870 [Paenibacillus psychroresistens]